MKKSEWKPNFIESLRKTANVSRSASEAGISRRMVYKEREKSDGFGEAWDDAIEEGLDYLEEEARRRAYEGTLKPVYQRGEEVGVIREFSDTLMIFLLKGRRREVYGDRREVSGPDGGPIRTETKSASNTAKEIREIDDHIGELDAEIAALEAEASGASEGEEKG